MKDKNDNKVKLVNNLKKMSFTIASDPEVHLFDVEKNKIVSSIPVLKNDKYSPIKLGKNINAYADSVLTEISIPPAKNKKDFINNFRESFVRIQKKLGNKYRLMPKSAVAYDNDELKEKAAWEIGCSPTFDAYKKCVNNPGEFTDNIRTGSTHIHVGNEKLKNFQVRELAIRIMDVFVGCSSVIFDKDATSAQRRLKYGKAGEFRMPEHGLEWRILGGYTLNSPKLVDLVFDLVDYSMSHIESNTAKKILNSIDENEIIAAINNCDKALAEKILVKAGLPDDLMIRIKDSYEDNFYKNWGIKVA